MTAVGGIQRRFSIAVLALLILGLQLRANQAAEKSAKAVDEKAAPASKDNQASSPSKPNPQAVAFFESKIRPVLVKQCYSCHSKESEKIGGNLRLDSLDGLLAGGQSGPCIVAGKPDASLIVQALKSDGLEMPPDHPLPAPVVADFVKWVAMGAPYPKLEPIAAVAAPASKPAAGPASDHWSLQPIRQRVAPAVQDAAWCESEIDRYVLATIEAAELQPAVDAPAAMLVRRLYFDLIGLPPTAAQVESFSKAFSVNERQAIEELVSELLDSPQFGVRWGRHWLDVARYGESNGNDGLSRNPTFPHAWRYRDYVIDALNRDVPYDRFITEQLAGDLLPADSAEERRRLWIATGYLAIGSKPAKAMNLNFDMDVVADQIEAVSSGLMGLTVGCARCHDHKHDPIPTRDYYALAGIFASTESLYGLAANDPLTAPATELYVLDKALADSEIEAAAPSGEPSEEKSADEKDSAAKKKKAKPAKITYKPGTPLAMGGRERKQPTNCKINIKGESNQLGPLVPRGFLSCCATDDEITIDPEHSGRLELAQWITSPQHPLTARVMVNRAWYHLFGRGIVTTCDDFGKFGERPSHPELLDHLAADFVQQGWSLKTLIRQIVLSHTYRLSCEARGNAATRDADYALLTRHARRRLDAESFRDHVLAVSGQLDLQPGEGSAIADKDLLVNKAGNLHQASNHRSVYLCMLRGSDPPELTVFDLPDALGVLGVRTSSTLPTQALFLINSPLMIEQSKHFAASLLKDGSTITIDPDRIRAAYRQALARDPSEAELQWVMDYLQAAETRLTADETDADTRRLRVWSSLCQALLASSEFRYVE